MSFDIINLNTSLSKTYAVNEIIKCNEVTSQYGIVFTPSEALELVETRTLALTTTGRIELGGGIIDKLILEFCTSSYLSDDNALETMQALIDIFYAYKNETLDLLSDDDLIRLMHIRFDGICHGSLSLLSGRELLQIAQNLRFGRAYNDDNEPIVEDEEDSYD